jgi:hypothetical protein
MGLNRAWSNACTSSIIQLPTWYFTLGVKWLAQLQEIVNGIREQPPGVNTTLHLLFLIHYVHRNTANGWSWESHEIPSVKMCMNHRRLLRWRRLIIMTGTEQMERYQTWNPCVWCIWCHSTDSAPAINTSLSSPIKVPPGYEPCYYYTINQSGILFWAGAGLAPSCNKDGILLPCLLVNCDLWTETDE